MSGLTVTAGMSVASNITTFIVLDAATTNGARTSADAVTAASLTSTVG